MQDKIKAALGEMMFNQIAMSDTVDHLREQMAKLMADQGAKVPVSGEVHLSSDTPQE